MQNMHVCDMLYFFLLLFENMSSQQNCKCWGSYSYWRLSIASDLHTHEASV